MSSHTPNVNSLFTNAAAEGILSPQSLQALTVVDLGQQIQAALGVPAGMVQSSEVVLVTMMPDDSGSIRFVAGNTEAIRSGHNGVLDALSASNQRDSIYAHCRYLNGDVLYAYGPLDQAVHMDARNYDPRHGTPLYDQTVVLLGTVVAKYQEFSNWGIPVRTVSLIMTDGHDQHSYQHTPRSVRPIVEDMLASEQHIIAAMGVADGSTDFRQIFSDMGIRDEWILTPGNNPTEIRRAFNMFTQSAARASQNAGSFSKTALGGFTNP